MRADPTKHCTRQSCGLRLFVHLDSMLEIGWVWIMRREELTCTCVDTLNKMALVGSVCHKTMHAYVPDSCAIQENALEHVRDNIVAMLEDEGEYVNWACNSACEEWAAANQFPA